ncbi:MAG: dihydrodipicolinate synthase family protein [Planctomycetota bacterium]
MLLPFASDGSVDWPSFRGLLGRTTEAGLTPAVNMDTGYVNLLDDATRVEVLRQTHDALGGLPFVAGAFVADRPGDAFDRDAYLARCEEIRTLGATPVLFQSYGLAHQPDEAIVSNYRSIASECDRFIGFELGEVFAPFGKIYNLQVYQSLMETPECIGAKHSSLEREPEWERLALRNSIRPDFHVYTGNDLAIDMIAYGSDYLLGLSAFAPDAFARRDALWEAGDAGWNQLNDLLQYLGFLAFRPPTPAYKHAAAMFLHARGWLHSSATHPDSPQRGAADQELLAQIAVLVDAASR